MLSLLLALHSPMIKIAVVDTGLDITDERFMSHLCEAGHKDFTGEGLKDTNGHGTHVTGLIQDYAGEGPYCLVIVKYWNDSISREQQVQNTIQALDYAGSLGVDFVNYSGGGPIPLNGERAAIAHAPNTTFVVAAGNEDIDLDTDEDKYYPASYNLKNIVPVGCMLPNYTRCPGSNYGSKIKNYELGHNIISTLPREACGPISPPCSGSMSGTSMSAAVHTGKLVRRRLKTKHF